MQEHMLKTKRLCKRNSEQPSGVNHVIPVMGKTETGSHGVARVTMEDVIFTW